MWEGGPPQLAGRLQEHPIACGTRIYVPGRETAPSERAARRSFLNRHARRRPDGEVRSEGRRVGWS
jgi:hypothetical protein